MKVLKEKHFLAGNFKAIAGLVFLMAFASVLFIIGKELTTGAVLGASNFPGIVNELAQ